MLANEYKMETLESHSRRKRQLKAMYSYVAALYVYSKCNKQYWDNGGILESRAKRPRISKLKQ